MTNLGTVLLHIRNSGLTMNLQATDKDVLMQFWGTWVWFTIMLMLLVGVAHAAVSGSHDGIVWTPDPTHEEGCGEKPCPEVS